jgi:23S rRNA (adenine2030-N6)-methyltransferase
MLSYRHLFHAGNHADILKHSILAQIALKLQKKDKPYTYLDTHAGAGLYSLDSDWAAKTGEAAKGIIGLLNRGDIPEFFMPYIAICRSRYLDGHIYPGSPEIVRALSRERDRLILTELHPAEILNLRENMSGDSRVRVVHGDGYSSAGSLCPPDPRRGFLLMDPSFETTDDYERVADTLIALHRRWPVGILAIWYPLVGRRANELSAMKSAFARSGIPGIVSIELTVVEPDVSPDSGGFGLYGSGMIVIQPPWGLAEEAQAALPWLAEALSPGHGRFNLEWLVPDA